MAGPLQARVTEHELILTLGHPGLQGPMHVDNCLFGFLDALELLVPVGFQTVWVAVCVND